MSKGQVDGRADKSCGSSKHFISAAIDFGTTFSGYAFSFKHEYEKDPCQVFFYYVTLCCGKASCYVNKLLSRVRSILDFPSLNTAFDGRKL